MELDNSEPGANELEFYFNSDYVKGQQVTVELPSLTQK